MFQGTCSTVQCSSDSFCDWGMEELQYGDGSASHLEHNSLPNKLLVIPETRIHLSNNNWQTAMGKMSCCSSRSTMKEWASASARAWERRSRIFYRTMESAKSQIISDSCVKIWLFGSQGELSYCIGYYGGTRTQEREMSPSSVTQNTYWGLLKNCDTFQICANRFLYCICFWLAFVITVEI